MLTIRQTEIYAKWFRKLRDERAKDRIDIRIRRLALGNAGDAKSVGEGVSELRIDHGPGYRVYFAPLGAEIIVLLCGGDKSSQPQDIAEAKALLKDWEERP